MVALCGFGLSVGSAPPTIKFKLVLIFQIVEESKPVKTVGCAVFKATSEPFKPLGSVAGKG